MKHLQLIGILGLAVVTLSPVAEAAPSCRVPRGQVLKTGAIARLISVPSPHGPALYACIRRTGRKIALDVGYSDARLTGRWVAWERRGRPGRRRVAVHDLRSGRERLVDGHVAAHSLALTARGSIAWAQELESARRTPLYVNDTVEGGRLLDAGDVDAESVRLAGRRLSWVSGGSPRAAVIR
jgi:hypothetical protein